MFGVEYRGCGAKLPGTGGSRLAYSLLVALARMADQQLGESGWVERPFAGGPRCAKNQPRLAPPRMRRLAGKPIACMRAGVEAREPHLRLQMVNCSSELGPAFSRPPLVSREVQSS